MIRLSLDRLKSYILILLIITSLIQVGILWSYNQGLPSFISNFISSFFPSQNTNPPDEYFKPLKIVISNGDESYWKINKSDADYYNELWAEGKGYIEEILKPNKEVQMKEVPNGLTWEKIISSRAFVFDFKTSLWGDLVCWFLQVKKPSANAPIPGIEKFAILPNDDNLNNSNTVYILYKDKLYRYSVPFLKMKPENYDQIISSLQNDGSLRIYSLISQVNKLVPINPDILVDPNGADSNENLNIITYFSPKSFDMTDRDKLSYDILKDNQNSYIPTYNESNGVAEFKNQFDVFRVHKNGLLEYKNLAQQVIVGSGVGPAFGETVKFLDEERELVESGDITDIYLSGVKESESINGAYEFNFDYTVKNIPVTIFKNDNENSIQNAITITATGQGVISCNWIMKDFSLGENKPYNVNFETFLNDLFNTYPELVKSKESSNNDLIENFYISYNINAENTGSESLGPVWTINTTHKNRQNYVLPMRESQGDK